MVSPRLRLRTALGLVLVLGACSGASREGVRSENLNVIDMTTVDVNLHPNAYAIIQALRPHWLQVRTSGTEKRVYLDDMRLGGLELLRQISASTIGSIEYYDGPAATQRWGSTASAGVIQVRTLSR